MCGRFALYSEPAALARHFAAALPGMPRPRYNIAPTQRILIVRAGEEGRRFSPMRWGPVPFRAKAIDLGYSTFNARAETVAEAPVFRSAFAQRRCLIPADGFYEWAARAGTKSKTQPFFFTLRERKPMAFAGLWALWEAADGTRIESCAVIVTAANALVKPIHDRMPAILPPETWETWLDPEAKDAALLQTLLAPYPAEGMSARPVGPWVNSSRHDGPECLYRPPSPALAAVG